MRGFSNAATKVVTLSRGSESLDFTIHAVPAGFMGWLRGQFESPKKFIASGKGPSQPITDMDKKAEYDDLFGVLMLAKGLEPSGVLDHQVDWSRHRSAKGWATEAHAVLDEMRAAHLTTAELGTLLAGVYEAGANPEEVAERGKSSPPRGAG